MRENEIIEWCWSDENWLHYLSTACSGSDCDEDDDGLSGMEWKLVFFVDGAMVDWKFQFEI